MALKYALDIRKFEIELYWKRATYFWAFIAAIFAGYLVLIVNKHQNHIEAKYFIILTLLGFVFSISWYLVNRGSKFWQQNWEMHVDFLEDETIGSLYRIISNPKNYKWYKVLTHGYPCSVSKINQVLSFMVSIIWIYLLYDSINMAFLGCNKLLTLGSTIVIVMLISILIFSLTKSALEGEKYYGNETFILSKFKEKS
jgi:ABC-type multidrug transport system fused ATPase/permease subunit